MYECMFVCLHAHMYVWLYFEYLNIPCYFPSENKEIKQGLTTEWRRRDKRQATHDGKQHKQHNAPKLRLPPAYETHTCPLAHTQYTASIILSTLIKNPIIFLKCSQTGLLLSKKSLFSFHSFMGALESSIFT